MEQVWYIADFLRENLQVKTPVDLVEFTERLGGKCEKTTLDKMERNFCDACIVIHNEGDTPQFTITYSGQISAAHTRFSIAHELGLLCLHLIKTGNQLTQDVRLDCTPLYSEEEAAANEFATALLMPKDKFVDFCESHGGYVRIDDVAEHFNVSRHAARSRGHALNLW